MHQLNSLIRHASASGIKPSLAAAKPSLAAAKLAAAIALPLAVALTFFGPTPPHAGAQDETFETNFSIRVPWDGEEENALSRTTISVTYEPASGADPACRQMTEMFTIHGDEGTRFSGGSVEPPSMRAQLVDTPMGSQTPCRYVANFDDSITYAPWVSPNPVTVAIAVGDNVEFGASDFADDGFLRVAYSNDTPFFPNVDLRVLQINDDMDDPGTTDRDETELNFFRNAFASVPIAPTASSPAGCSAGGDLGLRVQEDGRMFVDAISAGERGLFLIDVPESATAGERCEYTVTFPDNATPPLNGRNTFMLNRLGTANANLDAGNPHIVREYRRPGATTLRTSVEIRGSAAGVQWDVDIRPAPNSHAHCSTPRTVRLRASEDDAANGNILLPVTLVRRPVGANSDGSEDCEYDAHWPEHEVGGMAYRRALIEISASDQLDSFGATASFELIPPEAQLFTPSISITVPQLEGVIAGSNFLSASRFAVQLQQEDGSANGCSLETPERVDFAVQPNGDVISDDRVLSEMLIGVLADGTPCRYTVTFPPSPAHVGVPHLGYTLTRGTEMATLTQTSPSASSDYTVGEITFVPEASIEVPSGHEGKVLEATFTGSPAVCGTRTLVYRVNAGGVTADAANQALVVYPAGATASTTMCTYTVAFSPNEMNGATLVLQSGSSMSTSARDRQISASYAAATATSFTPSIAVSVPLLDGLTTGENIWAGLTFDVTIGRAMGAHDDCSLASGVSVTYRVQPGGEMTTTDSDLPQSLTDTLADRVTMCEYAVGFGAPPSAEPTDGLTWEMTAPVRDTLSGTKTTAMGAYTVGAITFAPDASITVPSGHAGKQFEVMFASTTAACVGQTLTYTVQSDDTVAADSSNPALVAYAAGATTSSEVCSYDVTFGSTEVGNATLELQPGSTTMVTGTSQAISATYAEVPAPQDNQDNTPPPANTPPDTQQPGDQQGPNTPPDTQTPQNNTPPPGDQQQQNPPQNTQQPVRPQSRVPSGGGGSRGGGGGGSRGGGGGGSSTPRETGPFVPSATQRVAVGVSLTLPADRFAEPTPIEVLINVPDECGTDVRTFEGLAASVGLVYAFDASSGATADIIAAGARQIAAFAERGTTQRPCALRVTLLSAPAGCTLGAAAAPGTDPAAARTDDAGRSYVELTAGDDATALNLTPALTCT